MVYLFLEVLLLNKFLKHKWMKVCLIVGVVVILSSCGMSNKIEGQHFDIQQHNKNIGSVYFSADYAQVKGLEMGTARYFINKVRSKRYLFIEFIPNEILSCKPDFWKTLKYKKDKVTYYVYLIENLDDEVFHLSALQNIDQKSINDVDDLASIAKSPHQNDRITLKIKKS